jgi:precorrin-3B synthase
MNAPFRRGTCPGLSAPMQTGDGLLVRLLPIGTISLAVFIALCAAAREHGNGVVEVTARGSIQVRGLSPVSAPRFAKAVAVLGIAAADGIAVHASPLAGLDPDEILDAEKLAADVRCALAGQALAVKLAPKIAVTVDGGGALGLDGLSADVRLRAVLKGGRAVLSVSVGGDRDGATELGFVAPADATVAVARILETIVQRGGDVRARDIIDREGVEPFGLAIRDLLGGPELDSRLRGNERKPVIGPHPLRDGAFGCGVGLAFGHADATSLENLTEAAVARGTAGLRAAPDRVLIFVGFSPEALRAFVADAAQLGFIVRADDPRRFVVACAGAPICSSAHIAARALAPRIAVACADSLGARCTIHLSGCAKGCAHPAPAALTVVGTAEGCGLVANGTARDAPLEMVTVGELPAALARHARAPTGEAHHV